MRKLETQILIDENTTDVFWGKGEDVEGIQVGDELQKCFLETEETKKSPKNKICVCCGRISSHGKRTSKSILNRHNITNLWIQMFKHCIEILWIRYGVVDRIVVEYHNDTT